MIPWVFKKKKKKESSDSSLVEEDGYEYLECHRNGSYQDHN